MNILLIHHNKLISRLCSNYHRIYPYVLFSLYKIKAYNYVIIIPYLYHYQNLVIKIKLLKCLILL